MYPSPFYIPWNLHCSDLISGRADVSEIIQNKVIAPNVCYFRHISIPTADNTKHKSHLIRSVGYKHN